MFVQTWNKYLPVIKILLKRSVTSVQTLNMNSSDFQRAAGGRKIKYTFSVYLVKGRTQNAESPSALAKDLIAALQQDDTTKFFIRQNEMEFSMNNSFQLTIKLCTPPPAKEEPANDKENTETDSEESEIIDEASTIEESK